VFLGWGFHLVKEKDSQKEKELLPPLAKSWGEGEADVSTFSSCVEVSETVEEIATKKIPTRIAILCQALSWINRDHIFFNT
jgi:hypothetical protein